MSIRVILFACLIFSTFQTSAQQEFIIVKGLITEKGTNIPVPFANLQIANSSKGTACNDKGEFILRIDKKYWHEKIKVSSIGYITRLTAIDSIKNPLSTELSLEADIKLLDEIIIKEAPLNPIDILKKAIDSISTNYLGSPFNMEFYSQLSATDPATNKDYNLETILFGYSPGYLNSKQKTFEIVQRRVSGEDPLQAINYFYWPSFEIHNADLIATSFKHGILNLKNIEKFDLKYSGVSLFDEDTVFTIEYNAPKPTKEITGFGTIPKVYKGRIYITTATNAIVKHEIETDQFSYSAIYKKWNGKYFPYYFYGERRTTGVIALSKVTNSITLKSLEINNVKVIDYRTNEFQNANLVKFDEVFWKNNYPRDK